MNVPLALRMRFGPSRAAFPAVATTRRDDGLAGHRCFHGRGDSDLDCLSLSHLERHSADRRDDMDRLSLSRIEGIHTGDGDLDDLSMSR